MTALPTESRIFADRYGRNKRRLETLHAGRLSPGATTRDQAVRALHDRMDRATSPTKRAAVLNKAIACLNGIKPEETVHIMFGHSAASRSASLCFATFSTGLHPFVGVEEEGLNIMQALPALRPPWRDLDYYHRGQSGLCVEARHGRLHERGYDLTRPGCSAFIGVLGHLSRNSDKHLAGELCLHFSDTLVVGSLKHSPKYVGDGRAINGTFYDVRTALPADEVRNQDMIHQGRIASQMVAAWFTAARPDLEGAMADRIPFLPSRADDYTLRAAIRHGEVGYPAANAPGATPQGQVTPLTRRAPRKVDKPQHVLPGTVSRDNRHR